MERKKQKRPPPKRKADEEPQPQPQPPEAERQPRSSEAPPVFVSVKGEPVQLGADTVIVYEGGAHQVFSGGLLLDAGGRLIVADTVYDLKPDQRYADASHQRVEENDRDCYEVDESGQPIRQHQAQQQQLLQTQPQQVQIQPQQLVQSDFEIVQFVPTNNTTNNDNQECDTVNDSEACWLNTKYDFIVRKLQLDYGAGVKLLYSPRGIIRCVYFTTPAMQQAFNAVPQFLCVETGISADICFKSVVINDSVLVKQSVSLIFAEDGNGKSIIVSAGISTLGDNTKWLMETFKSCNPAWKQIRCIIAEPGHKTEAIKSCFFGVHVCCNAWQASRWASRYCFPPAPLPVVRTYIDSLLKGQDPDQNKIRRLLGAATLTRLPRILDRDNLTNFLHNGVEKIIKQFEPLENNVNLQPEEFLTFFFDVVRSVEEERRNFALNGLQETINTKQSPTDTLTQYAYHLIHQQTLLAQQSIDQQNSSEMKNFGAYGTSTQECRCLFGRVFRLPCRHILMLTSELKVKSHIPFELRWTVYHCLFGCELEPRACSPLENMIEAAVQGEQQQLKPDVMNYISQREGQVIFCTTSTPGTFSSNTEEVHYIKAEPTTQPA